MSTSKDSPLYTAYKRYTRSKEWETVKQAILKRDHNHCMLCGRTEKDTVNKKPVKLAVHHNCYDHLGNELEHPDCLVTLCMGCHVGGAHRNANWNRFKMPEELTPELEQFLEKWGKK